MKNIKKLDMNEFAKTCLEYDLKSGVLIKVGENNVAFAHDIEDDDFDNVNTVEWMLNWYATDAFDKAEYSDTDIINGFEVLKKGLSGEIEMADSATYAF
jgi:hypothetical protein